MNYPQFNLKKKSIAHTLSKLCWVYFVLLLLCTCFNFIEREGTQGRWLLALTDISARQPKQKSNKGADVNVHVQKAQVD